MPERLRRSCHLSASTQAGAFALVADRAERPGGLLRTPASGSVEHFDQRRHGALVADGAEGPRRLLAHAGVGIARARRSGRRPRGGRRWRRAPRRPVAHAGVGVLERANRGRHRLAMSSAPSAHAPAAHARRRVSLSAAISAGTALRSSSAPSAHAACLRTGGSRSRSVRRPARRRRACRRARRASTRLAPRDPAHPGAARPATGSYARDPIADQRARPRVRPGWSAPAGRCATCAPADRRRPAIHLEQRDEARHRVRRAIAKLPQLACRAGSRRGRWTRVATTRARRASPAPETAQQSPRPPGHQRQRRLTADEHWIAACQCDLRSSHRHLGFGSRIRVRVRVRVRIADSDSDVDAGRGLRDAADVRRRRRFRDRHGRAAADAGVLVLERRGESGIARGVADLAERVDRVTPDVDFAVADGGDQRVDGRAIAGLAERDARRGRGRGSVVLQRLHAAPARRARRPSSPSAMIAAAHVDVARP